MWRDRCHFVVAVASWPDLAQPSTTLPFPASPVVDGRHKAGHDTVGTPARYFNAYRAWPGHPRLCPLQHRQSWMADTRPAMTQGEHQPVISTHMRTCPGMTRTAVRDLHHSS